MLKLINNIIFKKKIGTLDSLVVLSDDLGKYDQAFEGITTKIAENLKSLLHGDVDQWEKNLIVDDSKYYS